MPELTIMSYVCFIQTAENGTAGLFFPASFRALAEVGCSHTNEGLLKPLPYKMKANILKFVPLLIKSDCVVAILVAILVFARSVEINYTTPNCPGWFLYIFADAIFVPVPEWQAES